MNKQEWRDKKQFCIDSAITVTKLDKRLEDSNGVQFVPFTTTYTPPIPNNFIYVAENEILGGTVDWRVNNTSEYLIIDGVKVYEADCSEVV